MSLRIAFVGACPYPVPQGSQVYMRDTAQCLRDRGHEVCLVVYGHGLGEDASGLPLYRCLRVPGARRTAAGPSPAKPFLDWALLHTLKRVIREQKIDVICAHNYEGLLVALAVRKCPVVYFAHNAMSDELPYYFRQKSLAERAGRWLDRTLPRRAKLVVVPHQRLARHLVLRGCAPENVLVVPPPVDTTLFAPAEVEKQWLPPVLYTGNLDAYQNLGLLLKAMEIVRRQVPEARLLLASSDTRAAVAGAEMIHTPDFEGLLRVLERDAVFAMPRVSWSGYPIKLLNAMAAGKGIVACESAAHPLNDGVNGLVVGDNAPETFATALLALMKTPNLRKSLGQRARETVQEHHAPQQVGKLLEAAMMAVVP